MADRHGLPLREAFDPRGERETRFGARRSLVNLGQAARVQPPADDGGEQRVMKCPKCDHPRMITDKICDGCGLVFHKYEAWLKRREEEKLGLADDGAGESRIAELSAMLQTPPKGLREFTPAFALLWLAFVVWGGSYIVQDIDTLGRNAGFMHAINLPFHEAGHVLFGIFGQFVGSLGGTLGQLLMPAIAGFTLLWQRADTFGASVCLWWFGQNFLDIAPYMADARAGVLPLLGGNYGQSSPYGFHDWEYILGETGLLAWDTTFAAVTLNIGRGLMLVAMLWGARLLWIAWREKRA